MTASSTKLDSLNTVGMSHHLSVYLFLYSSLFNGISDDWTLETIATGEI